jgi:uncharacterized protein YjbJ (UPF0337 family)
MANDDQSIFDKAKDALGDVTGKITGRDDAAKGDSLLDKAKGVAGDLKDKVSDLVDKHDGKIDSAVDKTADFVDDKTGGKFSDRIGKAKDAAHGAVNKLGGGGTGK